MTGIMIGFTRAAHRLGTVYGNYSLDAQATGINAAGPNGGGSGDSTINLPATPSTNQTITIENTGTGTVTVDGNGNNIGLVSSTTVAPDTMKWFVWGGYTWGFVTGSTCATVTLPDTHDFGTTTQGPAETAYDVPANTVTYSNIGYTPCGGLLRKIITTTYDGREVANQWKVTYTSATRLNSSYFTNTDMPDVNGSLPQTAYAATMIAAFATVDAAVFPASFESSLGTGTWSYVPYDGTYNLGTYTGFGGFYRQAYMPDYQPATQLTLYYLDTHIVWTYEIV